MLVFRAAGERLTGSIDIPQQGANNLALRAITVSGTAVRFELATGGPVAVFDGRLDGDRLSGTFTQGAFTGTFALTRGKAAAVEPIAPPPPYRVEPLTIANGHVTLAGTLTRPDEPLGPVPAVVLITGSGPQNRDEDIFGFKIFAVLADHLTRQGIAVFRHDDRGVGESTGTLIESTTEDFARDALAAAAKLRTLPGIDPKRVGLVGHSEGAVAAAIAAATSRDVAFIVMLAGTAVPGDQVLRQQARDLAIAGGASKDQVDRIVAAHRGVTDAVIRGASSEEQMGALRALVDAQTTVAGGGAASADRTAVIEQAVKSAAVQMASPWMKFMLVFDPAASLRSVTVPVFAVFGELDTQVPPTMHETPMRAALAGNPGAVFKTYPGANHLFQRARTGQVAEYATLEKAFVAGLLDDLAKWILAAGR
jgi:pimeloyl-ACP methyl ester carboxylesterase